MLLQTDYAESRRQEGRASTCRKRTKHIVIDGSVAPHKRQGLVNDFQNDSRVKVALLSIQAAGVGLTLTVSLQN